MVILLLTLIASAGPLGEGAMGRPWHSEMRLDDTRYCRFLASGQLEQLLISVCPNTLGGSTFTTNFMYFDNSLYGAITVAGDRKSCTELKELSFITWGLGTPSRPLPVGVIEGWSWNYPLVNPEYRALFLWDESTCSLAVFHMASAEKVDAATKAAKAKEATGL